MSNCDKSIEKAAKRDVGIYIYYKKSSQKEYEELSKIAQYCVKFEEIDNHSKCVIKDRRIASKRTVAIGSYNWLSESVKESSNASMVLTGMFVQGLGADIWDGIRFYQNLKYKNTKGINKFSGSLSAFTTGEYKFEEGEYYYTLSTPEAHETLFNEVIEKAKERVFLFSPFIRLEKLQNIFTDSLLEGLQKRNVNIKLITLPSPCTYFLQEQVDIFSYLDKLSNRFSHFSYVKHPNFHAKTLLADGDFYCDGSRNCLSSVDDLGHGANNFELSVAVRGKNAKKLIEEFEKTDIGKSVLSKELIKGVESKVEDKKRKLSFSMENSPVVENKKPKFSSWQVNSNNSQWQNNSKSSLIPNDFEILPGYNVGKNGFCVRFDKRDYLKDEWGKTFYFPTTRDAEDAALEFMPKSTKPSLWQNNSYWQHNSKSASKKNNFEIFSGRNFGQKGFCVRFDKRDYLMDEGGEIVYFRTKEEAQQAAYYEFQ